MTTATIHDNPVMDKYEWRHQAKCAGDNPTKYDLGGDVKNKAMTARELCAGCPVVQYCAKEALAAPSVGMVRAGMWIPLEAGSHTGYAPIWVDVLEEIAGGEA